MSDIYLNLDGAKEMTYDAIVVGSGISGGWAAKELTEKGLKVLMLERGGDYKHIKDYDDRSAFEREHKGKPTFEDSNKRSDIINWMLNEQTAKSWVDETKEGKYIINIYEPFCILPPPVKKVEILEKTIEIGYPIRFPTSAAQELGGHRLPLFNEKVGSLPADEIEFLKK